MKLLVTGGTGLIGREVSAWTVKAGHELYSAYHVTGPEFGTPVELEMTDSSSMESCFRRAKPDVVIHLAALTYVDRCETDRDLALKMNVKAVEVMAKDAKRYSVRMVYVSTDYVFDGEEGMYRKEDKPNPVDFYGESKLKGEEAVKDHADSWCIARTSTPFGLHPKKKTFPVLVAERLSSGQEMQVVEDQYTSPTYTENLAGMLGEVSEEVTAGIIHLASGTRVSGLGLAVMLAGKPRLDVRLLSPAMMKQMRWVAKRPRDSSLNVDRLTLTLKPKPLLIENALTIHNKTLHARPSSLTSFTHGYDKIQSAIWRYSPATSTVTSLACCRTLGQMELRFYRLCFAKKVGC